MKNSMNKLLFLSVAFCASFCEANTCISSISYELNGGRFGDNIRSFTQAYWEAYKHNLPLLYVPFPDSNKLILHTQFAELTPEVKAQYREVKKVQENQRLTVTSGEDTLYLTTYFCRTDINWKDPEFVKQVQWLLSPQEPIAHYEGIEQGIAVHVRRGGGFHVDTNAVIRAEPAHFPNLTYFARSLDHLIAQLEGRQTIFLFTDDQNPQTVAQQLFNELAPETAQRVEIRYRGQHNAHDRNVIDDFMALRSARYLIRPISNFSEYAELLGNHECVVIPARHRPGHPYGIIEAAIFLYKDRPADMVMLL